MAESQRAFCEQCRKMVEVELAEAAETTELDGVAYSYPVTHGVCLECGGPATPVAVQDENQRAFTNAVRKANGIVDQATVEDVPKKYSIGKRPLSKMLGWGEHTYSRFLDGDVPSKDYSKTIERIARSPLAYLLKLYNNINEMSDVAFRKSKDAALRVLRDSGEAIERAAAYLIARTGSGSPLALQKELYYADGLCISYSGAPLFPDRCEAWRYGPVFPRLWEDIELKGIDESLLFGDEVADYLADTFSSRELEVLDAVTRYVACFSPYVLRDCTHDESPWIDARAGIPDDAPSNNEMTLEGIGSFFRDLWERYDMERPADIRLYMKARIA